MARYEHLPIYRDALAFAVHIEQVVAGFSRYHKYTLGTELRQTSRHSVQLIMGVNSQTDKRAGLLALREHIESVLLLLRIAKEPAAMSWAFLLPVTGR